MSEFPLPERLLAAVAFFSFGWVYLTAWLFASGHLAAIAWRRLRGRPGGVDHLRLSVFLPLIVTLLAILAEPLGFRLKDWTGPLGGTVLILWLVLAPIVVTLVISWRRRSSLWLYLNGVVAIVALPMAMVMATLMLVLITTGGEGERIALIRPDTFVVDPSPSACTRALTARLGFSTVTAVDGNSGAELILLMQFWLDATFKAVFLDAFEAFGCSVTPLVHNTENLALSALVFGYRTFAAVIVLGVLLAPILTPLRRGKAGLALAARQSWSDMVARRRLRPAAERAEAPAAAPPPPPVPPAPAADPPPYPSLAGRDAALPLPGDEPEPRPSTG